MADKNRCFRCGAGVVRPTGEFIKDTDNEPVELWACDNPECDHTEGQMRETDPRHEENPDRRSAIRGR